MLRPLRQRFANALDRRFAALAWQLEADGAATRAELAALRGEVAVLRADVDEARGRAEAASRAFSSDMAARLRLIASDEPGNRRRLEQARLQSAYERAFSEREPLVSICIPTFDRVELLLGRSLPSVLGQTYENIEVIVVGDAAKPEVGRAVAAVGDPRLRYQNLTHRIDYGSPQRNWEAGSVQARNHGYAEARGAWISDFDDDDELRPEAIAHVVAHAQTYRLEAVYGRLRVVHPGGEEVDVGVFPPALGQFGWQGGVVHGGLRAFTREHAAAAYGIPNDWERAERMLRAGVRFGMLDEVLADLYPSPLWGRAPTA